MRLLELRFQFADLADLGRNGEVGDASCFGRILGKVVCDFLAVVGFHDGPHQRIDRLEVAYDFCKVVVLVLAASGLFLPCGGNLGNLGLLSRFLLLRLELFLRLRLCELGLGCRVLLWVVIEVFQLWFARLGFRLAEFGNTLFKKFGASLGFRAFPVSLVDPSLKASRLTLRRLIGRGFLGLVGLILLSVCLRLVFRLRFRCSWGSLLPGVLSGLCECRLARGGVRLGPAVPLSSRSALV